MLLLKYRAQTALFLGLAAIYICQVILVKPSEIVLKRYGISEFEVKLLALTIALPYLMVWIIGLLAHLRLKSYSDLIKSSKDGMGFKLIAWGVFFLALWLPLSTIINSEATRLSDIHHSWVQSAVIINNYLNILILAPAFLLVYLGSRKLAALAKTTIRTPNQTLVLGYIAFAALYTFVVLNDPVRHHPSGEVLKATYYLSDWLIILTIVIPRLLMWYLGLHAVQNILLYRQKVKGSLYKLALHKFAFGLCGVVAVSIILRSFQSFSPALSTINLKIVFVVLYLLIGFMTLSYVWMLKGSSKLLYVEKLSQPK